MFLDWFEDDASKAFHYSWQVTLGVVSLFKTASIVSLLTLASRITGLVRELLIASAFGASAMTDAFNVAWRIPNLFRRWFAEGAFTQAFVPLLAATKAEHGEAATQLLIARVATVLFWMLAAVSVLGVVAAPFLVWAMASGLKTGVDAAVLMTRFMFPYIMFMSLVALAAGVLNTWKRFAVPAATPVLLNLCWITAALWGAPWFASKGIEPIYAICVGVMVGGALQLLTQVLAVKKMGLLPKIGLNWPAVQAAWADEATKTIAKRMLPAILGGSVAQISLLINTQIASRLETGSVSWLGYADRFMELPVALLGVTLGVVLMPQLAAAKASDDTVRYSDMLDWGLRLVVLLAVPCAVALVTFATPVVATMFHHGAFTEHDVDQTALALMGWGVGVLGLVAIKVLASGFYANQDVKTPMWIAFGVLITTQLLNLLFVPMFAQAGLSLSIGVAAMLNALALLMGLIRRGSYKPQPGWWMFSLQVLAGSALMAILLMWASQALPWLAMREQGLQRVGWFTLTALAAALLYFAALWAAGLKLRALFRH